MGRGDWSSMTCFFHGLPASPGFSYQTTRPALRGRLLARRRARGRTVRLGGAGELVLHLDEQPVVLAAPLGAHADQCEAAPEFLAVQCELQSARGDAFRHG